MNCRPPRFSFAILFFMLIVGCSTAPELPAEHPLSKFNEDLITVSEDSQSELIIDCSYGFEESGINITDLLSEFIEHHVIEFAPDGRRVRTDYRIICGKKVSKVIAFKEDQVAMQTLYASTGEKELVFIFHGGLVSRNDGMKEALESLLAMHDDQTYWDTHHPIFINWRTGGVDAYREQTFRIRNGVESPAFGLVTAPYNIVSDLGSGIADIFSSATLEGYRLYQSIDQAAFNQCESNLPDENADHFSPEIICPEDDSISQNYPKGIGGTSYALATPVRMATSPLLNGLGRTGWENMVRRTRNLIWREKQEDGCSTHCLEKGGLSELFDRIADSRHKISMIGHSMGTMLITDIIHHYPHLRYQDIVFMAAAVSIREFQNSIKTLLVHKEHVSPSLHFYNLSLLPIAEAREFTGNGLLPSGSLLELIDEMFSSTPSRLDKTLGKWTNVREVMNTFPAAAQSHMTFKVFGLGTDQPITHGDFNNFNFRYWEESFWGRTKQAATSQ